MRLLRSRLGFYLHFAVLSVAVVFSVAHETSAHADNATGPGERCNYTLTLAQVPSQQALQLIQNSLHPKTLKLLREFLSTTLERTPFRLQNGLIPTQIPTLLTFPQTSYGRVLPPSFVARVREAYKVYRLTPVQATAGGHAQPMGPALTHAEFNGHLARLQRERIHVVLDTGLEPSLTSTTGLCQTKGFEWMIRIGRNSSYANFIHEVTHARFNAAVFESLISGSPLKERLILGQNQVRAGQSTRELYYTEILDRILGDPAMAAVRRRLESFSIAPADFVSQLTEFLPTGATQGLPYLNTFIASLHAHFEAQRSSVSSTEASSTAASALTELLPPGLMQNLLEQNLITQPSDFLNLLQQGHTSTAVHESLATTAEERLLTQFLLHPTRDQIVETTSVTQGQAMWQLRQFREHGALPATREAQAAYDRMLFSARYRYDYQILELSRIAPAARTERQNQALRRALRRREIIDLRTRERLENRDFLGRPLRPELPAVQMGEDTAWISIITPEGTVTILNLDALP